MTVQITVIGLGQVGTSIGLALAGREDLVYRVGHDRDMLVMNRAKSLKAFDATQYNLPASVEKADLIVLCLPFDQVEETLKIIGPDLREDAVVLDMSPLKSVVAGWFQKHIPAGRHYVGLIPALNPQMLMETEHGLEAARAELFQKATIGIAAPEDAPVDAIKLAEDLVRLLGGQPLFIDMHEADGLMTTAHILPQVMSVALLNATVGQPGWEEARRFAGRPYALASAAVEYDTLPALAQILLENPEKSTYMLNQVIGALTHLREAIAKGDETDVKKRLKLAFDDRVSWLKERQDAKWSKQNDKDGLPKAGDWLKRLFTGERPKKN